MLGASSKKTGVSCARRVRLGNEFMQGMLTFRIELVPNAISDGKANGIASYDGETRKV
jgi:hypothetical protein